MKIKVYVSLILSLLLYNTTFAAIIISKKNGSWSDPSTWDLGRVPLPEDSVYIDGHTITIEDSDGAVQVAYLQLDNDDDTELSISESASLSISGHLIATAGEGEHDLFIKLADNAILEVMGEMQMTRIGANNTDNKFLLEIKGNATVTVLTDFTYAYYNTDKEDEKEIRLSEGGTLDVRGKMELVMTNGEDFDVELKGTSKIIVGGDFLAQISGGDDMEIYPKDESVFWVKGDATFENLGGGKKMKFKAGDGSGPHIFEKSLTLNSQSTDKDAYIEAAKNSTIKIKGDIIVYAVNDDNVYIDLKDGADLYFGGNLQRPNGFGALYMHNNATIYLDGASGAQTLSIENLSNSGTDEINITNIVFDNPNGFILTDTFVVDDNLTLSKGNFIATDAAPLLIEDQATITGASDSAFIEGPVIKMGRTDGSPFLFPIGVNGRYAPIEISALSDPNTVISARVYGDPPPFLDSLPTGINDIADSLYWELGQEPGGEEVEVRLYWDDAGRAGIDGMDSIVVLGLDGATNNWENYGNEEQTGKNLPGSSGSVSSRRGDPPPFLTDRFTIGGISGVGSASLRLETEPEEPGRFLPVCSSLP
ncbi:MAG: hypothetical protein AAFP19_17775 [Bacteroidota bacterium]